MSKPSEHAIKLLTPVLTWLEAGAPHQTVGQFGTIGFDMESFQTKGGFDGFARDHNFDKCGTACCIAGAVSIFNGIDTKSDHANTQCHEIGDQLGLSERQIDELFFAETYCKSKLINDGIMSHLENLTPRQAAKTLRRFMETGVVLWEDEEPAEAV